MLCFLLIFFLAILLPFEKNEGAFLKFLVSNLVTL